ncbi:Nucleoporin NUP133 [Fusarium venenatum]|uniref:Non-repetitive/WGA-negative nucleoporin C-terminal-domain-containing protein n=1 Tax=Fusarium venenatum TaxID=56646 RepID=UPI001E0F81F9|nr:Nucleoporin NUP133 [Fusarium venenatum]KAH7003603.1 Non-repetitive/WGA-negative nucleoporin C-terminal-domain-containing protein [Fusarium venenatum]
MFSPSVAQGGPATATRSRRRQRPVSSERTTQQPKAKRQRLPLTEQTFVNPDNQQEMVEVKADAKVATLPTKTKNKNIEPPEPSSPVLRKELNVRVKKAKHGDRAANKGDGSLVLTSTNAYTVSKLPALPDRIRSDWSAYQTADIFSTGYALSLTQTHALVWPYTSTSQSPETFSFSLPSTTRPNEPLPVGCLVSPSASSAEPGLVVVMGGSGKVVYWESIASAATFVFMKKDRTGVEYTISGMHSGEKVVAITNAESAGFILTFNSGRLAYMNVRDSQGRPSISVQFLRNNLSPPTGGIFGSIRHAFQHLSLKGDIAAVRADRSARTGERNIVALTGKGRLNAWRVHRGGHNEIIGDADVRGEIIAALQETDPVSQEYPEDSFEAVDFTYVPKGLESKYLELSRLSDAMATDDSSVQHLLVLVSLTLRSTSRYALVEAILTPWDCQIGMIRPITSYSAPFSSSQLSETPRPRLYLPRPALVAFVVFDRATVIASITVPPQSPESQLQIDSHILPAAFEDVIDFREDDVHEIIGSGFEEIASASTHEENRLHRPKTKNPAVVLMVRGAGAVRIVTTDVDKFASDQPPKVSAKSKIEQAVFFGVKQDNPLIFDGRQDIKFSDEEIAEAALEISHEILSSSTPFISTLPASLEDNLRARSNALERLITQLRIMGADLNRKTRWSLLYDAEKMHVATLLWKRHEAFTAARPANDKKSLVGTIVEFIHQGQKHNPVAEIGEVDRVRHWFINDVFRLELFVAWAYEVIKTLYKDNLLDDAKVNVMIYEAIQVYNCTYTAAHDFRKNSLSSYGLGFEELRLGILRDGYDDLPEPWTGSQYVANNAKRLVDLSDQWVLKNHDAGESNKAANQPDPKVVSKIFEELPTLIDGMLTSVLEYARWSDKQTDQKVMSQQFAKVYATDRFEKPLALARSGKWEEGASIAEKHECLRALSVILLDHIQILEDRLGEPGLSLVETQNLKRLRDSKKTKLQNSFSTYGQAFAFPAYEFLLQKHGVEDVLEFDLDNHGFKTQFLRSKPELARISWINDVQQERDVGHSADTLIDLALKKEQQVWSKKIELSLGKLALMAELEEKDIKAGGLKVNADEVRAEEKLKQVDRELVAIKIQDQLYHQVLPSTYDAVDDAAALNFAMEVHSMNIPRRQKAQHQIFEDGMKRLLQHEALDAMTLIDLLTLIYLKPESRAEIANPFWLALLVAENSCHPDEVKEAKRMIWRRLFIRDDWSRINDTQLKDDREVVERLEDTELYSMLTDCISFQDTREPFRPQSPKEALGAFTDNLDRRFRDFEASFRTKLIEVMKHEDKLLHQFIEKNRLGQWVHTTFEAVRAELDRTLDTATKNPSVIDTDKVMAGSIFDTDMSVDTSPVGRF